MTDGLEEAPFGCNGFRQRVIALLFYRLSSAKIVLGTIVKANDYGIHDNSLEKRNKSVLLRGNEKEKQFFYLKVDVTLLLA